MKLKALLAAVVAAVFIPLLGVVPAGAATAGCQSVPNKACSSWETPAGGGTNLDVFQQRTAADTPLIVFTPGALDPAEDFEVVPVPAGVVSIYSFAGSQTATTAAYVNIEYAPRGVGSGMCVSDIDPVAGQADELRACNSSAGKYNPFQSFIETTTGTGDGTFTAFEDSPVSTEGTATGLYLSDSRPDNGIGVAGSRVAVVSLSEEGSGLGAWQLWETNG